MRQKSRILVIALAIISASMALDGILVVAAAQTAASVGSATAEIEKFLKCVNEKIEAKKNTGGIDISDTVACLPGSCTVTATMSADSAQKACKKDGCQLPRVIVKCPESSESPQIEFSYLLCGTSSESPAGSGKLGSNRIEIGAVAGEINGKKVMVMADIHVPPGTNAEIKDVLSLFPTPNKGCNADGCHEGRRSGTETPRLSERIEVFGTSGEPTTARNPSFIIFTDDCEVAKKVKDIPLDGDLTKAEKFSDICKCINENLKAEDKVLSEEQLAVVKKLCDELAMYQHHTPWPTCTPTPKPSPSGTPPQPTPKPSPTESPTVITLSFFSVDVVGDDGAVLIQWETASEIYNAEFNLYRAKTKDGRYKKINDTPIPAQGSAVYGASYSFVDRPPATGTYYYKLEDVDYYGVSTLHGPVKVRVRSAEGEARRKKK